MYVDIEGTKQWFENYLQSFDLADPMLKMKYIHSYDVMRIGETLVKELAWDSDAVKVGIAASLLHDTGRFSQYRDFKTYHDARSGDHGHRGADVLTAEYPRSLADEEARFIIIEAVKWHNKKALPALDLRAEPFCRLTRDADKLDVFRLVQRCIEEGRVEELLPRHKLDKPISLKLLEEVEQTGMGSYNNAESLLDYLLIQLTWVRDINYIPSLKMLRSIGVLDFICERFPKDERVQASLAKCLAPVRELP